MCFLPQVEPLRVFRKGFGDGGQVSKRTVNFFDAGTTAAAWAGRGGSHQQDLYMGTDTE